jgi:hypothetical protein
MPHPSSAIIRVPAQAMPGIATTTATIVHFIQRFMRERSFPSIGHCAARGAVDEDTGREPDRA